MMKKEKGESREPVEWDDILSQGVLCAYQDWDSGGPGAGAGRVSCHRYRRRYYVMHDAGLDGPFATIAQAIDGSSLFAVTEATQVMWLKGRGYSANAHIWRKIRSDLKVALTATWGNDDVSDTVSMPWPEWLQVKSGSSWQGTSRYWYEGKAFVSTWTIKKYDN